MSAIMGSRRGVLEAKGGGQNAAKKWKRFTFDVKDGWITWFKDDSLSSTDSLVQLPLAGTEIRFEKKKSKKRPNQFTLASPHNKFKDIYLNGDTKEETDAWIQAIRDSIDIANPGIFGKDLSIVQIKNGGAGAIPKIITHTLEYLSNYMDADGIFRLSGNNKEIEQLKAEYNSGVDVSLAGRDCHCVSGVVKLFLRELPDPLCTFSLYQYFLAVAKENPQNRVNLLVPIIQRLPEVNRNTLKFLLQFLNKVAERSAVNKMTALNLGTVFGPTILRTKEESIFTAGNNDLINSVTETMIAEVESIFGKSSQIPMGITRSMSGGSMSLQAPNPNILRPTTPTSGNSANNSGPPPPMLSTPATISIPPPSLSIPPPSLQPTIQIPAPRFSVPPGSIPTTPAKPIPQAPMPAAPQQHGLPSPTINIPPAASPITREAPGAPGAAFSPMRPASKTLKGQQAGEAAPPPLLPRDNGAVGSPGLNVSRNDQQPQHHAPAPIARDNLGVAPSPGLNVSRGGPPPIARDNLAAPPPVARDNLTQSRGVEGPPPVARDNAAAPPPVARDNNAAPVPHLGSVPTLTRSPSNNKVPGIPPPVARDNLPVGSPGLTLSRQGSELHAGGPPPPVARDNAAPPPVARDNAAAPPPVARDNAAPPPVARDNAAPPPVARDNNAAPPPVARDNNTPPQPVLREAPSAPGSGKSFLGGSPAATMRTSEPAKPAASPIEQKKATISISSLQALSDNPSMPRGTVTTPTIKLNQSSGKSFLSNSQQAPNPAHPQQQPGEGGDVDDLLGQLKEFSTKPSVTQELNAHLHRSGNVQQNEEELLSAQGAAYLQQQQAAFQQQQQLQQQQQQQYEYEQQQAAYLQQQQEQQQQQAHEETPAQPDEDEIPQLPPGWELRTDAEGRIYFIDVPNKKTSWDHPLTPGKKHPKTERILAAKRK